MGTMLIEKGRVGDLSREFEEQLSRTKRAFQEMPISKWHVEIALAVIHTLTAITRTCLLRYRQVEEKQGQTVISNRQLMVVNMQKWSNLWRAARFLFFSR